MIRSLTPMSRVKVCEECGATFARPYGLWSVQWMARRFCGNPCASREKARHRVRPDRAAVFWTRVDKQPGGCWVWKGYLRPNGYGTFSWRGHQRLAHRVAWEIAGRVLDPALTLDHLCRNRACVNLDHLEQVTMHENWRRGESLSVQASRRTHCPYGHQLDGRLRNGSRYCLTCNRERANLFYHRQRAIA